jgi:DNA-binding transcriptional ArsR family regulator
MAINQPMLTWDLGTAYDLFISIQVIHDPDEYGLRASWAAGVRSRLPANERKVLEESVFTLGLSLPWIHGLPEPRDSATALRELAQVPARQRLSQIAGSNPEIADIHQFLDAISTRGSFEQQDIESLRSLVQQEKKHAISSKEAVRVLEWWSHPIESGEHYLKALECYQQVFFAEEEHRILPALSVAQEKAQELANRMQIMELVEELSQGVRFTSLLEVDELVLAPSFWSTPIVFFDKFAAKGMVMTYGARPVTASLVPGEDVPDGLLRTLKAMADPTRLRIMQYLAEEPLTPTQLSRKLRLRPPTVVHHLHSLRMAGLVQLTLEEGGEKRYGIRRDIPEVTFASLEKFLNDKTGGESG